MCVACHQEIDPSYPSTLMLGQTDDACGDCHMKIEVADISWVRGADRPVYVEIRSGTEKVDPKYRELLRELARADIAKHGFRIVSSEKECDLCLTLSLSIKILQDDRFLEPGTPVRAAVLDMTLRSPVMDEPYVRRLGASKPEWDETEDKAAGRAIKDAWTMLRTHLLEALGSY